MGNNDFMDNETCSKEQVCCVKCKKLLAINFAPQHFEVKCVRCGELNTVFDKRSEQVMVADLDGKILYINNAMEDVTGYKMKEVIGHKSEEFWGGQMKSDFYREMWKAIKEKKIAFQSVKEHKNKNGEKYSVDFVISPILDPKGCVIFYFCVEMLIKNLKV